MILFFTTNQIEQTEATPMQVDEGVPTTTTTTTPAATSDQGATATTTVAQTPPTTNGEQQSTTATPTTTSEEKPTTEQQPPKELTEEEKKAIANREKVPIGNIKTAAASAVAAAAVKAKVRVVQSILRFLFGDILLLTVKNLLAWRNYTKLKVMNVLSIRYMFSNVYFFAKK